MVSMFDRMVKKKNPTTRTCMIMIQIVWNRGLNLVICFTLNLVLDIDFFVIRWLDL